MTKTEARAIAKKARQYGYFHSGSEYSVYCPRCRELQTTQPNYGYFPVGKNKPASEVVNGKRCSYRQETVTETLDRLIIDHLPWCEGK